MKDELDGTLKTGGTGSAQELHLISFKLGDEEFGVEIGKVREILKMTGITPVPKAPPYLLGMMNLRGAIIPVLDLKKRLVNEAAQYTEKTRILVLSITTDLSGIVVDEVKEVQRIDAAAVEPPPQVVRGIDKFYLEGVARLKDDQQRQRLIMMLNLNEVLNIEIIKKIKQVSDAGAAGALTDISGLRDIKTKVEEDQVVVFNLGEGEFGLDIASVKEILKKEEITSVPNVPHYVKGIQDVRDTILPIIDLRALVGMESLEQAHGTLVKRLKNGHHDWADNLSDAIYKGTSFTRATDPTQCELGKLLIYYRDHDVEFGDIYNRFKPPHDALHGTAREVLEALKTDHHDAVDIFTKKTRRYLDSVMKLFEELEEVLNRRSYASQRILIVDIHDTTTGLLVDRVNQVTRLPKDLIDTTPAVISTYGREIRGVAKLNEGKRLILMADENQLLSDEEIAAISQIRDQQRAAEENVKEETAIGELQYVLFSVEGEEFGLTIDRVREIFKPKEITPLPKSPVFIKGVTNVRGTIIPVVDVKERFGVAVKDKGTSSGAADEKILVVLIKDTPVGLLVDNVREVRRIPENLIEDAPSLVLSNVEAGYMEGIAKLDNGERIILLLNIDEIMTKKEFAKLEKIKIPTGKLAETKTKRETSKTKAKAKKKPVKTKQKGIDEQ